MDHTKLVVVQSYGSRSEVELAMSELEAAGIPATIQADTAGGMWEPLACFGAGFKILLRQEDAAEAREVLTPPAGAGEILDAGFPPEGNIHPPWCRFT
jgi:hypothetical protein